MVGGVGSDASGWRGVVGGLRGDGRVVILVVLAGAWFVNFGVRMIFPVILPHLQGFFGFGLGTAGVLLTALWFMYAVGQLPGGVLADRLGERVVLVAGLLLLGVGLAVVSAAVTLMMVFVGTFVIGLALGLYSTPLFTVLSDVFTRHRAAAQGVTLATGNLGSIILPVTAVTTAGLIGWRFGLAYPIPILLAAAIGVQSSLPARLSEAPTTSALDPETFRQITRVVRTRSLATATLIMILVSFFFQAFTSFYPTYLITVKNLSTAAAATLFALFFATAMLGQLGAGLVSDRIGPVRTLTLVLATASIGLIALPFATGPYTLLLVTLLIGVQSGTWPVINAYTIPRIPAALQGGGFGLIRTGFILITAFGSTTVGLLAEQTSLELVFASIGITIITALIVVTLLLND